MIIYKILLFIGILSGIIGQMSLKKGMKEEGEITLRISKKLPQEIILMFLNQYVLAGVLVYGLSTFLWIIVLSKLDLSYAYPLVSVNFVLIALFSRIFFKEKVTKFRWFSIFLIFCGVIFVSIS